MPTESAPPRANGPVVPPPDTCQAEVVAHDRHAGLPEPAHDGLDVVNVRGALRAVEQDVVPVRRIEVLDGGENEAFALHRAAERDEVVHRPEPLGIPGPAPAAIGAGRLAVGGAMAAAREVVHEMRDDGRRAGLPREAEMLAREHVLVETESELHDWHRRGIAAKAYASRVRPRFASIERQLVPGFFCCIVAPAPVQFPAADGDDWRSSGSDLRPSPGIPGLHASYHPRGR